MISVCVSNNNAFAYLFWRWVFRKFDGIVCWLDQFYFGSTRGLNDYDNLARKYTKSNIKPDKHYSILPTVLNMVGDYEGKSVIDLGCGSGFFTLQLAQSGALSVLGVDNSIAQIELARKNSINPNTSYCVGDIFTQYSGIPVDIITAPFVVNYARTVPILKHFFSLIFKSLKEGGKAVLVIDLPNGKNLKRFGAIKTLNGKSVDETRISIDLFNDNERICTLTGIYYKPDTVERLLLDVGFHRVTWCTPVITKEGLNKYGSKFWEGYIQDPELGYVIAYK